MGSFRKERCWIIFQDNAGCASDKAHPVFFCHAYVPALSFYTAFAARIFSGTRKVCMIFSDSIQVFPRSLVYMGEGGEQPMIAEQGPSCNVEETFSRLVAEYQKPLLHMCAMMLRDDAAAEDAVQETFLKVFRALPQFRGECSEKTWLMRIAMNTCRDMTHTAWFRHTDRRITPEELQLPVQDETSRYDDREELAQAIMRLPRKYRDALLLYY